MTRIQGKGETFMKAKIVRIEKGKEGVAPQAGVAIPDDYLRQLELIPGSEVELALDKKKKWIIIRPMHGDAFFEHFKDTMEAMA